MSTRAELETLTRDELVDLVIEYETKWKELGAASLCVCASVSKALLAKRGDLLASTLVDPISLRVMADVMERYVPGGIDQVRDANRRTA